MLKHEWFTENEIAGTKAMGRKASFNSFRMCKKIHAGYDHVNDKNRLKLSLFIVKKMSTESSSETYWPNLKYATLLKQLINERNKRKNTMELK